MTSVLTYPVKDGITQKVETITYSNGVKTQRIYNKVTDVVPFDVIWLTPKIKPLRPRVKTTFSILAKLAKHAANYKYDKDHPYDHRVYVEVLYFFKLRGY